MADHRGQRLFKQQIPGVHVGAKDDCRVERLGFEVDRMLSGSGQGNLHLRETLFYLNQTRHQPAHRAGRGFQAHHRLLLAGLFCHHQHLIKRGHQLRVQGAALRG